MSLSALVPRFYLYGEPHRRADGRFAHIESLADRSRPSEWTIRPHAHADLNHLFHIVEGGGEMSVEDAVLPFDAPCLIIVPAGVVHGFGWTSESKGTVVTVSTEYFDRLGQSDAALAVLFHAAAVAALDTEGSRRFAQRTADLIPELGWVVPGHRAAIESGLLGLFVQALRAAGTQDARRSIPGHQAALVARFKERVEARFRMREPVGTYSAALLSSSTRLRAACAAIAGRSPMRILDERTVLEAQRALLYTNLSISEIAESLGMPDAAYFSRFFSRHAGMPPQTYRSRHTLAPARQIEKKKIGVC